MAKSKKGSSETKFYSGTSGLQVPLPKYLFPPAHQNSSRLTYYATLFNSVEINSSFYKLPLESTVIKWINQVPDKFKFTFKLWKEITHQKNLNFKEEDIEKYFKIISKASDKKGCVLIQFPPSIGKSHTTQLEALLKCIQLYNTDDWKIAVEFRNKTWYDEDIYEILNSYKAALVIQDIPKSHTPFINHSSDFIYIRFHGPTGNYRDSYSDAFLMEYSFYIKDWIKEGKEVYAYFNNTMGDAIKNLETLNRFVKE